MKNYEKKGWEVVSKTKLYTTLRRPKRFNWTAYIVLSLILNIFGLIGYPIYYGMRPQFEERVVKNV